MCAGWCSLVHCGAKEKVKKMSGLGTAIKRLREERGWSQDDLGKLVGIDGTNIARREIGRTRVKPSERPRFAAAFGMSLTEFDDQWRQWHTPRTRGGAGIPIVNRAPAGQIVDYEEYGVDSGQGFEYVDRGTVQDELAFGIIVVGDSMEPVLRDGNYVILLPCDPYRADGRLDNGKIVFVRFTEDYGGGCTLARFYAEDDVTVRLHKDNPAYKPIVVQREDIQAVAIAVERRVKL